MSSFTVASPLFVEQDHSRARHFLHDLRSAPRARQASGRL